MLKTLTDSVVTFFSHPCHKLSSPSGNDSDVPLLSSSSLALNVAAKSQGCTLHAVATGYGAIAASQRSSPAEDSGFSFVGCRLTGFGTLYLGRAWGRYARVVYSYCDLSGIVLPQGWSDWGDRSRTK